jgi:hypothetical protein
LSGEGEWVWNNFTWSNSSVSSQTVGWRLYANNSDGKVENSSKKTFDVGSGVSAPSVEVLEPVGVNGSNATLRGNVTSLGGASSVDVGFNVTSNSSIGVKDAGSVSSVGIVTDDLIDLEVATAYNFTITADNEEQIALSNRQEFITRENIDGFESGDFDKWSNVPASWEIDSSVAHEGSLSLYKQAGVGPSNSAVYNGDIEPPSQGSRFHWYHRWNGNSNGASFVNFGLKDWNNRYQTFFNPSDNIAIIRKFEDGGFQDLATKSISGTSNNWYKNEIIWYKNNTIVYRIIDNGNLLGKLKTTDNTYTNGKLGLEAHGDVYIDSLGYDVLENK